MAQWVDNPPAMQEMWVQVLGQEDTLEKEMAIHSSNIAWKIPWTEELCRLQSMGSQSQTRLKRLSSSTLVRMAIIKKSTNNKCWRGYGEKETCLQCW